MAAKKGKAAEEKKAPKKKAVTGFEPLKFKDFTITQKRSGRFQVVNAKGKFVNGADKIKILVDSKVLKESVKKAATEQAAT